ncbi:MAG: porin Gram-negative type [Rhizobacter sp.]|nr:porin Gram-negative type [Rhizobacter sp.]
MKNSKLIVCSAMALACGAACAQSSSLTMFGVVDLGAQRTIGGGKGQVDALSNGGLSTSRIGFRGKEDLGDGLYSGFWLEGSLNPDTGSGRASNTNNQTSGATPAGGLTFDRMAYVSLGSESMGEVRLGHDFIPTHYNSIYFDPFNANGVARAGNLTFSAVGAGSLPTTITGSNTISYWLPRGLGGFYGMAMVGSGENPSNTPTENDGTFAGARFGYTSGPFDVAIAMTQTRYAATSTIGKYTHANLGGTYDAGFAKFFALYNTIKVEILGGDVKKDTYEIGAHIPVFQNGKIRLSYARLNDKSAASLVNGNGSARSGNDAQLIGVGYVHDLSKRTALYATAARLKNEGQANFVVSGGIAPANGKNSTGMEVGLRHLF